MKQKNPIEENQKLNSDVYYLNTKLKEAKTIIREKDKIIAELKKNLDDMKTKTHPLLFFLFT
jgi:hypothetical protein